MSRKQEEVLDSWEEIDEAQVSENQIFFTGAVVFEKRKRERVLGEMWATRIMDFSIVGITIGKLQRD